MTASDGAPPPDEGPDPELDPDILEELEFWGSERRRRCGRRPSRADRPTGLTGPAGPESLAEEAEGTVVLVGTPIGNLGDLSPRAVRTLEQADVIFCEDTRHSRRLLTHAGITGCVTPLPPRAQRAPEDR